MKVLRKSIVFTICLMMLFFMFGEKKRNQPLTLEEMRKVIAEKGLTFTVGETSVLNIPLDHLCGLVEPSNWRETGRFDGGYKGEVSLPSSFDWRDYGVVTNIQNQGSCGSCWAFGTIGSYESCVAVAGGGLDDLSEEWLLDCNSYGYDCGGGWWAFGDLYDGVPLESCYPYVGSAGTCYTGCTKYHPMDTWYYVGSSSGVPSTTDMKNAMYSQGPIGAAVYVDYYFQAYTGGIFTNTASYTPNHAVILVGWNDSGGYWIMKNSWGTGWGENGYMRIAYGANNIGYAAAYGVPEIEQPPVADFSGDPTTVQLGSSVQFTDLSTNTPTSWAWTFEGGTPSTSGQQNPTVTYNTLGTFDVTLVATNAQGSDTEIKMDYITVTDTPIYCSSQGNSQSYEYIAGVAVADLDNPSGATPYSNFTSLVAHLTPGGTVNVALTPGFSGSAYTENWKIWIDYNIDGDFEDSGEEVFSGSSSSTVTGNFSVPSSAGGSTRMRLSMSYSSYPLACGTFTYGEVEDYTVNIGGIIPAEPDFNNDGRADIIWRYYGTGGYNAVWLRGTATTAFSSTSQGKMKNNPGVVNMKDIGLMVESGKIAAKVDMDTNLSIPELRKLGIKDGFEDYQMSEGDESKGLIDPFDFDMGKNQSGQTASHILAATVSDPRDDPEAVELQAAVNLDWKLCGTGDFNNDGKVDLLWRNLSDGRNVVWYMDGLTRTQAVSLPSAVNMDWTLCGTGDFNNDGKVDLVWRSISDGRNLVWYMNGVTRTGTGSLPTAVNMDWTLCGTGDFNNDGKVDLVWRNISNGRNLVWYLDGLTMTGTGNLQSAVNFDWTLCGTGDFNNDGKVDLLWRNISNGKNTIWFLDGVTTTGYESLTTVTNTTWKIEN
jgi:PKD repeat protein